MAWHAFEIHVYGTYVTYGDREMERDIVKSFKSWILMNCTYGYDCKWQHFRYDFMNHVELLSIRMHYVPILLLSATIQFKFEVPWKWLVSVSGFQSVDKSQDTTFDYHLKVCAHMKFELRMVNVKLLRLINCPAARHTHIPVKVNQLANRFAGRQSAQHYLIIKIVDEPRRKCKSLFLMCVFFIKQDVHTQFGTKCQ